MGQELSQAKAALAKQQQEAADLAAENERQGADIEDKNDAAVALQANLATLQGRLNQIEIDLATARNDALREREAAEAARIELAKALLRLEAMPRLEADLGALRVDLEKERQGGGGDHRRRGPSAQAWRSRVSGGGQGRGSEKHHF